MFQQIRAGSNARLTHEASFLQNLLASTAEGRAQSLRGRAVAGRLHDGPFYQARVRGNVRRAKMVTNTDRTHVRTTHELAEEALENGNPPFGSLLVVDESVIESSTNTTLTEEDITAHPELKLARYAARELSPEERAACTMYTSTEPCSMCASAIYYAGLGRVVYSVSGSSLPRVREDRGIDIPCEEVIERGDGTTEVEGPVLEEDGLGILGRFYEG